MEGGIDVAKDVGAAIDDESSSGRSGRPQRADRVNVHRLERVASAVAGGLLIANGLKRGSPGGVAAALAGAGMLYRGISGHCNIYQALGVSTMSQRAVAPVEGATELRVQRTVTIDRPAADLYRLWQEPATLQQVMAPFAAISATPDGRAHWSMPGLLGRRYTWKSHVVERREGELLGWESTAGSKPVARGALRFSPALGNRGTRVSLALRFDPPAGVVGRALFKALDVVPSTIARHALQRFKSLAETGEIPTNEGSPSARESPWTNRMRPNGHLYDRVTSGLGWFSLGLGFAELLAPRKLAAWAGLPDEPLLLRALGLREITTGVGILSTRRRRPWLWSRVAGDAMDLALLGAALKSPESNRARVAAAAAAVAGVTAVDAITSWRQGSGNDSWAAIDRTGTHRN